jgi:hypothetical protein
LSEKVTPALKEQGIHADALPPTYRLHDRDQFPDERFVELLAEKRGSDERVAFSRIVEIEEVRRRGSDAVADDFCKRAANALANIEVK